MVQKSLKTPLRNIIMAPNLSKFFLKIEKFRYVFSELFVGCKTRYVVLFNVYLTDLLRKENLYTLGVFL